MILALSKKLSSIDSELSIMVNVYDGITTIGVHHDVLGDFYTFSSTNELEVFSRVNEFINSLDDGNKFFSFIREIEEEPLGV